MEGEDGQKVSPPHMWRLRADPVVDVRYIMASSLHLVLTAATRHNADLLSLV